MGYARECWYEVIKSWLYIEYRVNHLGHGKTAVIYEPVATFVNSINGV